VITHALNKTLIKSLGGIAFLLLFSLSSQVAWGQKELSEKRQRKFDEYFFEGQRLKMIKEIDEAYEAFESALNIDPTNGAVNYELAIVHLENYRVDLGL
jgi:tetratricopeptide (TPR) repeat protein